MNIEDMNERILAEEEHNLFYGEDYDDFCYDDELDKIWYGK